jgi:hypothetical protein
VAWAAISKQLSTESFHILTQAISAALNQLNRPNWMQIEGACSPYGLGGAVWHGPYQTELCRELWGQWQTPTSRPLTWTPQRLSNCRTLLAVLPSAATHFLRFTLLLIVGDPAVLSSSRPPTRLLSIALAALWRGAADFVSEHGAPSPSARVEPRRRRTPTGQSDMMVQLWMKGFSQNE